MTSGSARKATLILLTLLVLAGLLIFGPALVRLVRGDERRDAWAPQWRKDFILSAEARPDPAPQESATPASLILLGARMCARKAARYDASYRTISYPMGDVPDDQGACTDVIVRSLRAAGIDLQQLIHEDMLRNFSTYPNTWGLSAPDPNIDHRRAPNQMCYLRRHWQELPTRADPSGPDHWLPGDLVYWHLPSGFLHCGVVSDRIGASGLPMVIHNLSVCKEEDCLGRWKIIAHFRYPDNMAKEVSEPEH